MRDVVDSYRYHRVETLGRRAEVILTPAPRAAGTPGRRRQCQFGTRLKSVVQSLASISARFHG
jgi:hypothetical protein